MSKKPTQVLSYLYLGSKADAKAKEVLVDLNIKYILNCTPQRTDDPDFGCPNFYQKDKSFVYKRIPIFDNKGEDIIPHMDTAFKFIEEGQHYGNVLVHCHKGVSRSASFVIGYLMRKNEFSFEEALSFVQTIRPVVQPNEAFLKQLMTYKPHDGIAQTTNSTVTSTQQVVSYDMNFPPEYTPTDVIVDNSVVLEESTVVVTTVDNTDIIKNIQGSYFSSNQADATIIRSDDKQDDLSIVSDNPLTENAIEGTFSELSEREENVTKKQRFI